MSQRIPASTSRCVNCGKLVEILRKNRCYNCCKYYSLYYRRNSLTPPDDYVQRHNFTKERPLHLAQKTMGYNTAKELIRDGNLSSFDAHSYGPVSQGGMNLTGGGVQPIYQQNSIAPSQLLQSRRQLLPNPVHQSDVVAPVKPLRLPHQFSNKHSFISQNKLITLGENISLLPRGHIEKFLNYASEYQQIIAPIQNISALSRSELENALQIAANRQECLVDMIGMAVELMIESVDGLIKSAKEKEGGK